MKNLLYILLFLPALLTGQTRELTKDSSYITASAGHFFAVNVLEYDNGEATTTKTLIGDTAAVVSLYANRIATEAGQMAAAAQTIVRRNSLVTTLNKLDTLAMVSLGLTVAQSPLTAVSQAYDDPFLAGSWVQIVNGTTTAVTFAVNGTTGRIRMTPQGSTARTMFLFGDMLRITNWPTTGVSTTLFKMASGQWTNVELTIRLRRA
jgi:hypothetical protein